MSLAAFWAEMQEKAARDVGQALAKRRWVLTSYKPYWGAAPNETRQDIGRIECATVEMPWNSHLDTEVTACSPEQLVERIEQVEAAAKARTTCCEGECPECMGDEEGMP